jgi:hypothetical protein
MKRGIRYFCQIVKNILHNVLVVSYTVNKINEMTYLLVDLSSQFFNRQGVLKKIIRETNQENEFISKTNQECFLC